MTIIQRDLDKIDDLRRQHVTPGMTAGEFARLLPERLRQTYWRSKIGEYCRGQGIDLDAEEQAAPDTTKET